MASRSQTKPEISPKIGAKSKASMIRSQPYITLPHLSKKSGTSVDVKVDVKNVTEPDGTGTGGDQARFFTRMPCTVLQELVTSCQSANFLSGSVQTQLD